jgi:UDP-N-acetylmuramoyl-L-alanyl-D-glutamate--2,6-diaminopimelate ligase
MQDRALSDIEITGLTADSRDVMPGFLFAAMPGNQQDGAEFIPDAIAKGAAAVLVSDNVDISGIDVPCIVDAQPRHRFAELAASYYVLQPDTVVAVTGTSGKSSIVGFIRQIWQAMGIPGGSLGTLGAVAQEFEIKGLHTTPEPAALHHVLKQMADCGVDHLALEASSHGIDQARLDGVRLKAALFTNLSRDHLDYHNNSEDYFAAKAQLFDRLLPGGGLAIVNRDSEYAERVIAIAQRRGQRLLTYGRLQESGKNPDFGYEILERRNDGQLLRIKAAGENRELLLPLVGEFQAENAVAALAAVVGLGGDAGLALNALANLKGAKGRLELVASTRYGARVYVDYAHKPEAIAIALRALRPFCENRLLIIFGCGGDRDQGKRPLMAAAAKDGADLVIVTDDNPRSEDPAVIRQQALAGAPNATEVADRREAIRQATAMLRSGDILLIAGKGHESGQEIAGEIQPFNDGEEAQRAVQLVDGVGDE